MRRAGQSGVALVLVLWVSVLITVIAASFIVERRTETLVVRNSLSLARAEAAANAGVHRGLFELYRPDPNAEGAWPRDGTPAAWTFDGIPISVELLDESAKIDLNVAAEPLLRGLLTSSGLGDDEANRLLDAIVDWRDPDSLKRPNGAEESDYRAAGLTYTPANAPFQALEELQLVLGMRPELYRRLAPSLTVFSRQPGVNTQLATREVLLAIPGATSAMVDEYIAQRDAARQQKLPPPAFPAGGGVFGRNAMVASVRSTARLDDGTAFTREAVALLRPIPRRPVTFVSWKESTAGVEAPAAPTAGAEGAPQEAAPR